MHNINNSQYQNIATCQTLVHFFGGTSANYGLSKHWQSLIVLAKLTDSCHDFNKIVTRRLYQFGETFEFGVVQKLEYIRILI